MQITIEPTEEFFAAEKIPVRAWKGTNDTGNEVIALVAAVMLPGNEAPPNMRMIPPPVASWSPVMREHMTTLWQLAERLNDEEAGHLAQMASTLASYRVPDWPMERACDHCQRPYRGPAVYCSLRCAQADA